MPKYLALFSTRPERRPRSSGTTGERETILAWNELSTDGYRKPATELVDATRPLDHVVDDVLRVATT